MIIQHGLKKELIHKKYVIGAHPIIQFYMTRLKIDEIIGTYVQQDKRQKVSTEKTLCLLIHSMLTSSIPLYEIADWLKPLDDEILGLEPDDSSLINDDRVGNALEKFYKGKHKEIFFRLALRAIKLFEIDCRQIHQDTTSVTFSGKYDGWRHQPFLTHGVNKDHRPDLKQLVLGMSVSADGAIPLVHEIYDGNQTDDRLHPANHKRLRKLLQHSDFIYVADCKLATEDNLRKITTCGGQFVSVMPRTWKEDKLFRNKVRDDKVKWRHLLSRPNNRQPESKRDHYYIAGGKYTTDNGYRLHWIRSMQKAEQDAQTRTRHIEKALERLRNLQMRINSYSLKTRQKIRKNILSILKGNKCMDFIDYKISQDIHYKIQYNKVGRPKRSDKGKRIPQKQYLISFKINEQEIQNEARTDGVFPLITNLKSNAKKILEIYKFQPFLEKRHSQLKTYQEISPVFLKKPERVIASLHMHVMALMVATLMERQLRTAMKRKSIETIPIYPEGKPCKFPTTFDIVRLFKDVERYEVIQSENVSVFPAQINKTQKHVLELLEVPISLYL